MKYKKNSTKKNKYLLIIITFCFTICLLLLFIVSILKNNINKTELVLSGVFENVEDVLKYYQCKYISEKKSTVSPYEIDINLIFKCPLYSEQDESNEKFFNEIVNEIAKVLYFKNFRMIDKEHEIEIKVICKEERISKIIINDIEDYFIFMDSQISLKKYRDIPITQMQIEEQHVLDAISNNWNTVVDFGTRESIFNKYYVFFDEGIEVRNIDSKIYNIVFTTKYKGNIINGIYPGMDLRIIKNKLGNPTFEYNNGEMIGYKGEDIYVFFTENEISVYRVDEIDYNSFFNLVEQLINDEKSLKEFMNDLTYLWPDYSEYSYSIDSFFISYPLKGIDIKVNYDNVNGIVLYNNLGLDLEKINSYLKNTEFIARLQIDDVAEAENRRYLQKNIFLDRCKEFKNNVDEEKIGKSNVFDYFAEYDDNESIMSIRFISKNNDIPNSELNDNVYTFGWLNDDCFIYSKMAKGIYYYDVKNRVKGQLIEGKDEFKIDEIKDNIVKYDSDKVIQISY